jgi:uncharacterized protein YdeI (YjbR/CyaY-like superfamily)
MASASRSRPALRQVVFFASAEAFRGWLEEHRTDTAEVWVGFYHKAHPRHSLTYHAALDAALCHGWIDGVRHAVASGRYTIRFTPRTPKSAWSRVNIRRAEALEAAGLMHPAGLRAFRAGLERPTAYAFEGRPAALDRASQRRLRADPKAWAFWSAQRPSYRRTVAHWVTSAKKAETRETRLVTLIAESAKGRWIPPMRRAQPGARRD